MLRKIQFDSSSLSSFADFLANFHIFFPSITNGLFLLLLLRLDNPSKRLDSSFSFSAVIDDDVAAQI